jgi:hypothetical protein
MHECLHFLPHFFLQMRCEGPIDGPCNRCQTSNHECIFDRPRQETKRKPVSRESFDAVLERVHTLEHELQTMKYILPRTNVQTKKMHEQHLHLNAENLEEKRKSNISAQSSSVKNNDPTSSLRSRIAFTQDTIPPIFQPPAPMKTPSLPTFISNSFAPIPSTSSYIPSFDATNTSYPFPQQSLTRATKSKSLSNLEDLRGVQEDELPPPPLPMMSSRLWNKENTDSTMSVELSQDTEMNNPSTPIHEALNDQTQQQSQQIVDSHTASSQASLLTTMAEVMEAVLQNADTMNVQRLLNGSIYPASVPNTVPSRTAPIMPPIQCETYEQTTPCDSAVLFPPIYTSDGPSMLLKPMTTFQGEEINRQTLNCIQALPRTIQREGYQVITDGYFDNVSSTAPLSQTSIGYSQMSNCMDGNISRVPPPVSLKDNLMMQPGTIITHQPFFHS